MCKLSEVPARFMDFAKASPVFACVMLSLVICGASCWYIGDVMGHHNDRLCDLMTCRHRPRSRRPRRSNFLPSELKT